MICAQEDPETTEQILLMTTPVLDSFLDTTVHKESESNYTNHLNM